MRTADWVRLLPQHPVLGPLLLPLAESCEWQSVTSEARPILVAAMYLAQPRKILIVAANHERMLQWEAKLILCGVNPSSICHMPSGVSALFEDAAPEHIALSDRLGALHALTSEEPWIVITTPGAALERTLPRDVICESFFSVRKGEIIDPQDLARRLQNLGYEKGDPVRLPGQFSQRGGIFDLFPTGQSLPIRIELFGDEIESLRYFDPSTQRSTGNLTEFTLVPSRETLYVGEESLSEMLLGSMEREAAHLEKEAAQRLEELISADANALDQRVYFDRLDLYRPLLHPDSGCAIDLLASDELLILDEPLELDSIASRLSEELAQSLAARGERGEILFSTANDYMLPPEHFSSHLQVLSLSAMNALPEWLSLPNKLDIGASSLEPYRGRAEALTQTLKTYEKQGVQLFFATDQPTRAQTVLSQVEIFPQSSTGMSEASSPSEIDSKVSENRQDAHATLLHGNLGGGFVIPSAQLAFITDAELFGVARLKLPQKKFSDAAPIATVLDLKPGDYVVHINFGIGVFRGLIKREDQGVEKEYLYIEYQAPDKLFVPADQLDRIQKYLNPGDENPKLNKLTGGEWQRTISKAKEDAKEFARDLIKLYAKRKSVQRNPYGPDTPWQVEMEGTFPYVETPSQMRAIRDAKRDLMQDFPMDRLVCGDVGFGKTEVAIRTAFKAIQGGRQVAVLCPTTILSEQHYRNFAERLETFGVRMAILNRFRSASEKAQILKDLENGKLDLILGTHALLGKDVGFKNLGLIIIDEEQKFGVKQKEALKSLRTQVDVLSMSATPIPRTLSMALMDIRQMSLINDPPPGRQPVRTYLRPYGDEVTREAILRELSRGGQVYYVYNRVDSIAHVAEKLRKIAPTAKIGVGHGQMGEKELEPIMVGFIRGEIDVLLSTTIIENGLDIPNANTLIVEDADRLGLSQLYQLRGRVGRSDRQAYAYFLYAKGKDLTDGSMARLQALSEFSTLGSGYSLAFRDLQIRGAGDLLGKKQHGSMASVGYELYTQLINEAVAVAKVEEQTGKPGADLKDPPAALEPLPAFEIPAVALIPDTYIRDHAQRLYFYQRMMSSRSDGALGEVQAEVEDRYGRSPEPVRAAFAIMALRIRARELGIDKLDARQGRLSISFKRQRDIPPRVFSILGRVYRDCYLTKETLIWPYAGDPLNAIETMMNRFEDAREQYDAERRQLEEAGSAV